MKDRALKTDPRKITILVPLIRDELAAGNAERERAGLEHFRRAGEMLIEVKEQLPRGEWGPWLSENFKLSASQARRYMQLAEVPEHAVRRVSSMHEAIRPNESHNRSWYNAVRDSAAKTDVDALAQDRLKKEEEHRLLRQLSHRLIDIGYKVLSTKLHPDKGGSTEAMKRLNLVRAKLKEVF